jgi:phage shock protein A
MGILSRASYVLRSKVNALLNRAADPRETLDYSYEQLRDELQTVRQGIAELTTQKKRLEIQQRRLEENVSQHNGQAREAIGQGREDLARRALEKKHQKMRQIEELETQIADLQAKQDDLLEKKDDLKGRIQSFRTKKETMKARYEAAEASTRVSEAMTGAGEEMSEIDRTIERAAERTRDMEARSAALDELQERGALSGLGEGDELDRELEALHVESTVEGELETIKNDVGETDGADEVEGDEVVIDEAAVEPPAVDDDEVDAELERLREEET